MPSVRLSETILSGSPATLLQCAFRPAPGTSAGFSDGSESIWRAARNRRFCSSGRAIPTADPTAARQDDSGCGGERFSRIAAQTAVCAPAKAVAFVETSFSATCKAAPLPSEAASDSFLHTGDVAFFVHINAQGSRRVGKARHQHHVAGYSHQKACARRKLHVGDAQSPSGGSAS